MSVERQKLHDFENTGKYLFHGSGSLIEEFEPRQSYDAIIGPDGQPAVFASDNVDYAIFMAIINERNFPEKYRAAVRYINGIPQYKATSETIAQLNPSMGGYVYVFNKNDFEYKREGEWVSYSSVRPVETLSVKLDDFEPEITELI